MFSKLTTKLIDSNKAKEGNSDVNFSQFILYCRRKYVRKSNKHNDLGGLNDLNNWDLRSSPVLLELVGPIRLTWRSM